MKNIFLFLAICISHQSEASWTSYISCNKTSANPNGEFVIDRDFDQMYEGAPAYQLVLKGEPLVYFLTANAIETKDLNPQQSNEFVLRLASYDDNLFGFIALRQGVQRMYWVIRETNQIVLRAEIGGRPGTGIEITNWKFNKSDCK